MQLKIVAVWIALGFATLVQVAKHHVEAEGGEDEYIRYSNFKEFLNHTLNVSQVLVSTYVEDFVECAFECISTLTCFSFNIAIESSIHPNNHVCHLLATDKYYYYSNFVPSQEFHHYAIASPCESFPCQNDGKCRSLYKENTFLCECREGFFGNLCSEVGALITQKPNSVIVEEGQHVSLLCKATGQPTPTVTWKKGFSHVPKNKTTMVDGNMTILSVTKADNGTYTCSAKNLHGQDSAVALVTVIDRLKFTVTPPLNVSSSERSCKVMLNCAAQGSNEIVWKKASQNLSQSHVVLPNGTLLLSNVSPNDAGSYTCVAKNSLRSIEATSVVEVFKDKPTSCSSFKSRCSEKPSGNYIIDPDGQGGVTPFSVYCDMRDKGGVGVTVISHDSESRTHVANISGCGTAGCYSKDVRYTGVSIAQQAAVTQVSQNCEQFIKFECKNDIAFIEASIAWWVSRNGTRMNYWGGATGQNNMCACGVTNSCSNGKKCNCDNGAIDSGWREDSGLLTDKSALPVSQIRLGDLDQAHEEGYHTLGKLKCYGQA